MLAEIAEDLVRAALADHRQERVITLLAISVSHLREESALQLELPLGLPDERRRPGSRQGIARWSADRAMDAIRERFGRDAVGYAVAALKRKSSIPDAFRELAEKDLGNRDG
jgi:DNA polymerase-4